MGLLFLLLGGWALLGMAKFVLTAHKGLSENWTVFSSIFTAVPCVIPRVLLASVGAVLRSRPLARRAVPVPDQHMSVSARWVRKQLATLDRDFFSQKIAFGEYRHRRLTLIGE